MLKIGVLGAGHLGKIHLRLIKEIANYELAGFFDPSESVSAQVAADFNTRAFPDADSLIEACDVIDIVTPTIHHFAAAEKAIRKSKHIFIEKPLTNTIEEGKMLVRLASEANVKIQVGHVERFNPAFLAARSFIENPMFIVTHRLAQFNPRGPEVSVVLDLMIHDIDIVLSLVKANIRRISASGVAVVSETPDIANARLEFDNGAVANLTASRISLKNMRKSRFFRRDAYISVDFLEKSVNVVRMKNVTGEADPLALLIDLGEKGKKQIFFESPKTDPVNSIKMELETFAQAIEGNTRPLVPIEDGFKALEVAHKIIDQLNLNANFAAAGAINA
ncbi:MAG TPA: Gfo/Idh/MocA family oxidoreductase [Bacteroidia bacterium]|nr:Gfo/Idh/MocA family oxidoreductase [Bacteroidia bacterium]